MGKKARNNTAASRAPGHGAAGKVPLALARQPARPAPREATPALRPPRKNVGAQTSNIARLRVDEDQSPSRGCTPALLHEAEPPGLAVTYSFDVAASGQQRPVSIRFTGTRVDGKGKSAAGDHFEQIERVDGLVAGMGRVAITTRIQGVNPGQWKVLAHPVDQPRGKGGELPRRVIATHTLFSHLAHGPAVRLASWPALVGLGAVLAIVLQALLAGRAGMNVWLVPALSLAGCALGFGGGKAWYLALHRKHPRQLLTSGACIQGFLLVAFGVLVLGAVLFGLPAGTLLDVTTPGLFLGMAVGRPGCFLTGCCAGRPTGSRWGLWSSDRRLAIRRFPVQLVEAATALVIGVSTLVLVLAVRLPVPGAVFAGALAAYTFARQLLFPLRTQSRTAAGRLATMAACALILAAAIGVSALA